MSYLVIARRWRPTNFDGIVGQEHITRTLKNAIQKNRIAHAYLFSGPRGIGKTSTARVLAKSLNCINGPAENPCQLCTSCKEISEGYSMDVIEIDGASNTSVEDIRTLRENIKFSPAAGRYKVYIIDEVHMLSRSAFNALLKTLEEPPAHVIFIFATTEPHKIPLTVISRCQRFEFKKISYHDILQTLEKIAAAENITIEHKALALIAKNTDGCLRDAETLLDQLFASFGKNITEHNIINLLGINTQEIFFDFMECIIKKDINNMFKIIDDIILQGHDPQQFLKGLIEHCRNLLMIQVTNPSLNIFDLNEKDIEQLKEQSKKFSKEDILSIFHLISSCEAQLQNHSHPRYEIEFLCLKILIYGKTQPLSDLIEKISSLTSSSNLLQNCSNNSDVIVQTKSNPQIIPKITDEIKETKNDSVYGSSKVQGQSHNITHIKESNCAVSFQLNESAFSIIDKIKESCEKNKKTILANCLTSIKDAKFDNNNLILTFEESSAFQIDCINQNKTFIENFILENFKHQIKLKFLIIKPNNNKDDVKRILEPQRMVMEKGIPIIDKAVHIFEGKIVSLNKS